MTHIKKIGFAVLAAVVMVFPSVTHAAMLERQLDLGMSGADVSQIQAYLALSPSIYPEALVTGYFGSLTSAAVARFQSANDLPSVGRVGPLTLSVLNAKMSGVSTGGSSVGPAPVIANVSVNTNRNSASVSWTTNESASGTVYYSTSPLTTAEYPHSVVVSGQTAATDGTFRMSQNVTINGLDANTTYYYLVYTIDQSGNASVSWPATLRTTN